MRFTILVPLLSFFAATPSSAQPVAPTGGAHAEEPRTIAGDPESRSKGPIAISGWFVAPTLGTTGFDSRLAYSGGIRGGIYLNRRVAIGLTGEGIASSDTYVSENDLGNFASYGGLLVQYLARSNETAHASVESTIGSGRWCAYTGNDDGRLGCTGKDFIVFEPAANVELNVARHFRVAVGVGYRFALARSGDGPSSLGMSSLVVRSALVLGSF